MINHSNTKHFRSKVTTLKRKANARVFRGMCLPKSTVILTRGLPPSGNQRGLLPAYYLQTTLLCGGGDVVVR